MLVVVFIGAAFAAYAPHRHRSLCQQSQSMQPQQPVSAPCGLACYTQCSLSCPPDVSVTIPAGECSVQFPLTAPSASSQCEQVYSTASRQIRLTAVNLGPENSISFAPLRVGFSDGTFDSFDRGTVATAPIISVAEGGSGSDWFPAFEAAEPRATLGTVANGGPLLPGASADNTFVVSPYNKFLTFASMVVPSNDYFIGNDSPTEHLFLDRNNRLRIRSITLYGRDIWNAGSETTNATNAAFLQGGTNAFRVGTSDPVVFGTAGITAFNGLTTAANYVLDARVGNSDPVYRIDISMLSTIRLSGGVHVLEWLGNDAAGQISRCTQTVTVLGGGQCQQ